MSQIQHHLLFYIAKCHDKGSIQPVGEFKLRNTHEKLLAGRILFSVTISVGPPKENFTQSDIDVDEADDFISTYYEFETPEVSIVTTD